jgi:hypothetical protein
MPSVHVGWAALAVAAVVAVNGSRWRWIALAHVVLTAYVVVVTANHYWLDGVAALALIALIYFPARQWRPSLVP